MAGSITLYALVLVLIPSLVLIPLLVLIERSLFNAPYRPALIINTALALLPLALALLLMIRFY